MTKKTLTTTERFLNSLTPKKRKQFDKEHREFLISEMVLAAMAKDKISVRKLANLARKNGEFLNIDASKL